MKKIMAGRNVGKSIETIKMLSKDKDLWCIIPYPYYIEFIYKPLCEEYLSKEDTKSVLKRIITYKELQKNFSLLNNPTAKFHIEEADRILRDLLDIDFDTMTTSHWFVQNFNH